MIWVGKITTTILGFAACLLLQQAGIWVIRQEASASAAFWGSLLIVLSVVVLVAALLLAWPGKKAPA